MSDPITQAAIQARAYQLWEESGCVDGNHEEHWRRAEAERSAVPVDGTSVTDKMDGPATPSGMDGRGDDVTIPSGMDGAMSPVRGVDPATQSGIDGEISRPLIAATSKPRRWPTPIVDV